MTMAIRNHNKHIDIVKNDLCILSKHWSDEIEGDTVDKI